MVRKIAITIGLVLLALAVISPNFEESLVAFSYAEIILFFAFRPAFLRYTAHHNRIVQNLVIFVVEFVAIFGFILMISFPLLHCSDIGCPAYFSQSWYQVLWGLFG